MSAPSPAISKLPCSRTLHQQQDPTVLTSRSPSRRHYPCASNFPTMAEPQPADAQAGSAAAEEQENPTLKPASKDDAKAAAALSALDAHGDDADTPSKTGDSAALAGAMKDLKVDGSSESKAKAPPKKVKIDAKDVAVVVEQLDLSRAKATEFLRVHDGDILKAFGAYVDGRA